MANAKGRRRRFGAPGCLLLSLPTCPASTSATCAIPATSSKRQGRTQQVQASWHADGTR